MGALIYVLKLFQKNGLQCYIFGILVNTRVTIIRQMMILNFFTLLYLKKNGFLFMILCYILYIGCFLEFLLLIIKSGITFYLIYLILFLRKILRLSIKMLYLTPVNCIPTLFLICINCILNIFNSKKKKKWYF